MTAALLSNKQLHALLQNNALNSDLLHTVKRELVERELTAEQTDALQTGYAEKLRAPDNDLSALEKACIIIGCFALTICVIIASIAFLQKGETRKWRQFWQYLVIGYAVLGIILIALICVFHRDLFH